MCIYEDLLLARRDQGFKKEVKKRLGEEEEGLHGWCLLGQSWRIKVKWIVKFINKYSDE